MDLKQDPESGNGYQIPDVQSYHYWILEIMTGKVIGPLDDRGLKKQRTYLQISDDVVLKEIRDIKQGVRR